jgi:hypothetical protein
MPPAQTAFRAHLADNVATVLSAVDAGPLLVLGDGRATLEVCEPVPSGHKVAAQDIAAGDPVVKYGVRVGHATTDIPAGSWVHLHCMASDYDQRSSHLDVHTGAPSDIAYA